MTSRTEAITRQLPERHAEAEARPADDATPRDESSAPAVVAADSLVEEVSIDGMCGVY